MNKEQEKTRKAINKMLGNDPTKFFVGERVRCIENNWYCKKGHITTVANSNDTTAPSLFWVKDNLNRGFTVVCQTEEDYELVED